ncbi:MAG: FHA domain-containing protein [Thermoanaerobaculia bacterium]|nr:FHA domain-containing protein [Thermoanaerobaculia bacterium]MBP9825703.1 FHA domain-containing protein [Thermoanaerobaculia bacterium]
MIPFAKRYRSPALTRRVPIRMLTMALALIGATAGMAQEVPVVLALDSSRSLSAAESRATSDFAKVLLAGLPGAAKPGILVFDDEVRWLARPGAAGGAEALDAMTPAGRFTVLNDGLIEGVRALGSGGVLVLLSDGLDENSATTLEDAARLASERGVRLVTIGAGRADERTLRRLALLTGGQYAGRVAAADGAAVLSGIQTLRGDIAAEQAARAPKPAPVAPVPAPATAESPRPAPDSGQPASSWLLALGAAVAALGVVLGFLLARRRSASAANESSEPDRGTQPGVQWPAAATAPGDGTAPGVLAVSPVPAVSAISPFKAPQPIDEVQIARVRLRPVVRPHGLFEVSLDETAEFQRLPFSDSIERTLVLTAEVILTVREPGKEPRSYRLPPDRAVDIGRDATSNTLAFPDPTMSTQHLRVALDDDEVYLVDLGSTNGVLVGERRVDAVQLHPGDRFRAGMIEFEIGLHHASTGRVVETA